MKYLKTALLNLVFSLSTHAAITIPGANGTDGALNITANTEIDLSQAVDAAWDSNNTANEGKGVYDATKWAVVFKYTSVFVAAGVTVTFKNHPKRAPVVWLVGGGGGSGNVTINGNVRLDGQNGNTSSSPRLTEPGPGGYRGGTSNFTGSVTAGPGFGPGGGGTPGHASYGTMGGGGVAVYGNPSLVPLVGGSGGGGHPSDNRAGGAGGGALLIAASGAVTIHGSLTANGGNAATFTVGSLSSPANTGAGSGGGVRIVAETLSGAGSLTATGGTVSTSGSSANGRIRLERVVNSNTISVVPAPSVVDLAMDATALIWPPAGAPEAKIISLGGTNAPADPKAGFGTVGADVALPTASTTVAVIETTSVESNSQVKVRITPRDSGNFTEVNATLSSTISTEPLVLRWTATLPTALGYSAVQVKVIRP